jgi:hypothetical protein
MTWATTKNPRQKNEIVDRRIRATSDEVTAGIPAQRFAGKLTTNATAHVKRVVTWARHSFSNVGYQCIMITDNDEMVGVCLV